MLKKSSCCLTTKLQFQSNKKKSSKIFLLTPLAKVFADICKCPISSQTIKYRYKFKSNPKNYPKNS